MSYSKHYRDLDLEHPDITAIERNGYPDYYPDEQQDECAWCGARFQVADHTFTFSGEEICEACFRQWLREQLEDRSIADIADALDIPHDVYG